MIFDALADHAPDISKLAEPVRLRHSWINGHQGPAGQVRLRRTRVRQAARSVRTSGPSAVMATVCSMWAPREPSLLRSVQPSASV